MKQLFDEAREYGRVNIFTNDKGQYHAVIIFTTIAGVELRASSGHECKTPEQALLEAIGKASIIANQFKTKTDQLAEQGLITNVKSITAKNS
jgi:hypothetical protein